MNLMPTPRAWVQTQPWLKLSLLSLALGPVLLSVLAFLAYDLQVFQPCRSQIQALLQQADPQDRHPPEQIRHLIAAMHQGGASPSYSVAQSLHRALLPRTNSLHDSMRSMLWFGLMALHFSPTEMDGLYCRLASNGQGQGLNTLALRLFGQPLHALSESQAATVVAYTRSPSLYARSPEQLYIQRDRLLARLHAQ